MALGSFEYAEWKKVLRVNLLGAAAMIEALVENAAESERKKIALIEPARLDQRNVRQHPEWVRTDMGGASAPLSPADSVRDLRRVLEPAR
jgi:hypothetical protein